ncbi:MAG: hypothetical protein ACK5XN_20080 [Bacteroidota bacterium]|jgi:ribosome-binding ATPase YchF (GTP1/OBG family)
MKKIYLLTSVKQYHGTTVVRAFDNEDAAKDAVALVTAFDPRTSAEIVEVPLYMADEQRQWGERP